MRRVSISTAWARGQEFAHHADFFALAHELGFKGFELARYTPPGMREDIHPGQYEIVSVHYPCILPSDITRQQLSGVHLSSPDGEGRRIAIRLAKETIDLASEFGAKAVVLHLMEGDRVLGEILRDLHETKGPHSVEFRAAKGHLMVSRARNQEKALPLVVESLEELSAYASERGTKLGLENRVSPSHIPAYEELDLLLDMFADRGVGYWHDTGHAQIQQNLGFVEQEEWLRSFGSGLVGLHIHDTFGVRDRHLAPGTGEVDFAKVLSHLPEEVILVCEVGGAASQRELVAGLEYLGNLGYF